MSLIVIVIIAQAVSSTLAWLGFYVGIRALPGARARQSRWIVGSAMVAAAWLIGVFLLGAADAFRNAVAPARIPMPRLSPAPLSGIPPNHRRRAAALAHWHPNL